MKQYKPLDAMIIPEVDDAVIDAIYKISQAIWKKHGWVSRPNKVELAVYLEATMMYMNEYKKGVKK